MTDSGTKKPITIIGPSVEAIDYWRDVWRHRDLIMFLAWRDILVRYRQTIVGVGWTVLRPLASITVFTLVFGHLAQLPSAGIPYILIVLTGLLPWQLFSTVLTGANESLLANSHLISKVYFPRIIIPMSSLAVCIVDTIVSFILVVALLCWYGFVPGWQIILLPFITMFAAATGLGLGLIVAPFNAHYRDFRQIIPIALQLGVFASPVAYATTLLPAKWQPIYALNPAVGIIDLFRWCVLGDRDLIYPPSIAYSLVFTALALGLGIRAFRRMEANLADVM
jgi:lipopolysaccharide transport system permease protein